MVLVEDDELSNPVEFARDLTSLLQLPDAAEITALLIGRFQRASAVNRPILQQIIDRQPLLVGVPVLANIDIGHTNPLATLPIGEQVEVESGANPRLRIIR